MNLLKSYFRLLLPRVPGGYQGSLAQANAKNKVLKTLSEGNVSGVFGKVSTQKMRDKKRDEVLHDPSHYTVNQ